MDTPHFNHKRISDPVHGTIGLSELEVNVVNSRVFQRLRNVKQLGLAHYVFPGADYPRFSHSLGVCHITGRVLESLETKGVEIDRAAFQRFRLAALLHDVGHYPFSHSMEVPIENHYKETLIINQGEESESGAEETAAVVPYFNHESVGKEILLRDSELNSILRNEYEPRDIYSIILRESPSLYGNLVSSDLDADRSDFMLRSAHFTGLPYGSVDLNYLVSQLSLDHEQNLCLSAKALRAADHFLLCRYFDYQQIPFNKSVSAFELVLKDVISILLEQGRIDCSAAAISKMIAEDRWFHFDDRFILQRMQELHEESSNGSIERAKANSIINRKPPRLLGEIQYIQSREDSEGRRYLDLRQRLREKLSDWANDFGIDFARWYLWDPPPMVLTKIGSHIPVSAMGSGPDEKDKYDQAVRIMNRAGDKSTPIVEIPDSLMSILSNYALYSHRVYVLFPEGEESRRDEIAEQIREDLPHVGWK